MLKILSLYITPKLHNIFNLLFNRLNLFRIVNILFSFAHNTHISYFLKILLCCRHLILTLPYFLALCSHFSGEHEFLFKKKFLQVC